LDVHQALTQIAEIHRHLDRTEYYRGYRSPTMALTAVVAIAGAALQPYVHVDFVRWWVALAAFNALLVLGEIAFHYRLLSSRLQSLSRRVLGQFVPCLAAGGLLTLAWCGRLEGDPTLLPGLWCLFFSMGIFASRPYLPHGVGWVGLYYLMAGGTLLANASLNPWAMGGTFGLGQALLALTLYWNLERT
jgi:hypothetical protein